MITVEQPADDDLIAAAQEYVEQLRVFYVHAGIAAASLLMIFFINLMTNLSAGSTNDWSSWWSAWAVIGWAAGLGVHGLVVRLNRPKPAASGWEQRTIDRVLDR